MAATFGLTSSVYAGVEQCPTARRPIPLEGEPRNTSETFGKTSQVVRPADCWLSFEQHLDSGWSEPRFSTINLGIDIARRLPRKLPAFLRGNCFQHPVALKIRCKMIFIDHQGLNDLFVLLNHPFFFLFPTSTFDTHRVIIRVRRFG